MMVSQRRIFTGWAAGLSLAAACSPHRVQVAPSADADAPRVEMLREIGAGYRSPAVLTTNSRTVLRAQFLLDDDAYVLVGRVSPLGVVRILAPASPADTAIVRAHQVYNSHDAFTDFGKELSERLQAEQMTPIDRRRCCQEAGVFILASRTPFALGALAAGEGWAEFPLTEFVGNQHPDSALAELASHVLRGRDGHYTLVYKSEKDALEWSLAGWDVQTSRRY